MKTEVVVEVVRKFKFTFENGAAVTFGTRQELTDSLTDELERLRVREEAITRDRLRIEEALRQLKTLPSD